MQAEKLQNTTITPLKGKDTLYAALQRMQELDIEGLPVVDETSNKLIGQVRKSELQRQEDKAAMLISMEMEEPVKVFKQQHVFEAARLLFQYELQMLPVVDKESVFLGMLLRQDILETLPDMLNLMSNGSILSIKLEKIDFSLSEIVHLIEVEGAKILGLTVDKPSKSGETFEVSIKINLRDASRITSALRRYDYDIIVDDASRDVFGFDLENRADELMKYIDM